MPRMTALARSLRGSLSYVVSDVDIADKFRIGAGILELLKKSVCRIIALKSVKSTSCDLHGAELFSGKKEILSSGS